MVAYNKIIAIIGFIFALIAIFDVTRLSVLFTALEGRVIVGLLLGLLGLAGIYLFDRDYRIAVVEYILAGFGMICACGDYGIIACIIYIVAGIIAFLERGKSKAKTSKTDENTHYYEVDSEEAQKQRTETTNSNTRILWIAPVITFILAIIYI